MAEEARHVNLLTTRKVEANVKIMGLYFAIYCSLFVESWVSFDDI